MSSQMVRYIKPALWVAVLGFGTWTMFRSFVMIVSKDAALTAPVMSIRSPIEGILSHGVQLPGRTVAEHDELAHIENPWVDSSRVASLESELLKTGRELDSMTHLLKDLRTAKAGFEQSSSSFKDRRLKQLTLDLSEANARIAAEQAKGEDAAARRVRAENLAREGLMSDQDVSASRRDEIVAERGLDAVAAARDSIAANVQATEHGVSVDSLGADKPYSGQRIDDVNMQLIFRNEEVDSRVAAQAALERELERERTRVELLRNAQVNSPVRSRIWKVLRLPNSFVQKGEEIFQLVDCSRIYVSAKVSERNFMLLRVGTTGTFVPTSSSRSYRGEVVQKVSPSVARSQDASRAPQPGSDGEFEVIFKLDSTAQSLVERCEIGMTGEVRFDRPKDSEQ